MTTGVSSANAVDEDQRFPESNRATLDGRIMSKETLVEGHGVGEVALVGRPGTLLRGVSASTLPG